MNAFNFGFKKKKPVDFSKMKDNLKPSNGNGNNVKPDPEEPKPGFTQKPIEQAPSQAPLKDSPKKQPAPKIVRKKAGLFRYLLILILLAIFGFGLLLMFGPKYAPELVQKVGGDKILEALHLKEPALEDEMITEEEEAIEELVTVRTYRVIRGDFIDVLPGMGNIKGDREVELRFPVNGLVDSINFYEGDLLRRGDIIATLEQKDALLKLEYSKSKLKTQQVAEKAAEKKLEIHQTLFDEGIIIKPKLDEVSLEREGAKTQVTSAQKEVEFALAELDKTYLYSPIDSVMGSRDVEVGEFVTSNVKIASLYDTATVVAEIGIIEKDINRVALGQKARITVDTYPGVEFEGQIENIAPIIEGKSRTLTVKVRLKNDNPKGTLLPGMFARIWISVYEKKNTIKLPSSCLYDLDNNGEFDSVYAVTDENIANATSVKIGYVSTDYVEIIDGLREGEQVVSEAMAELKDKVKVDVIEVQEPAF